MRPTRDTRRARLTVAADIEPGRAFARRLRRRGRSLLRAAANVRHRAAAAWLASVVPAPRRPAPLPLAPATILVVRLDDIGDWVMTGPFLRELRAHYPAARITLVCKPAVASLAVRSARVDEVVAYAPPRASIPFDQFAALRAAAASGRTLAERGFDLAVLPRRDNDDGAAAMLAWAAGAPVRVGYPTAVTAQRGVKNRGYDRLLTHFVPSGHDRHEVERTLDVVRFLGREVASNALESDFGPDDLAAARALLDAALGQRRASLVAIAPGAALGRRRWAAANYGRTAATLIAQGCDVVVLGSADDRPLGRAIAAAAGLSPHLADLCGAATLPQTLALLSCCDLFIGNDSGPAHLAAAAGVPSLVISCHPHGGSPDHANAPERFRPWSPSAEVVRPAAVDPDCRDGCVETTAHCIASIDVADVVAAAEDRLRSATTILTTESRA